MALATADGPLKRLKADKWLFFAVFVFGAFAIVVLDMVHVSKFLAVGTCVVLLFAYAGLTFFVPVFRLRPDQTADNSYYMGLLFTLTSLGVALYRFGTAEDAAESILRNFGVAIFTTIVGLALRVFISQFREDPDDLEYEAKVALAETVRKLRGDLDQSVAEMQGFADGVRQALQEVTDATSKTTTESLSSAVSRFQGAADDMGKRFEATARKFEDRTSNFENALSTVVGAVELLSTRISSVRADPELIAEGLRPAFAELQTRVGEFSGTLDAEQKRLSKALTTFGKLSEALQQLEQSSEAIASSSGHLDAAAAKMGQGAGSLDELERAAKSAASAASDYSEKIAGIASGQALQGQKVIEAVASYERSLADRTGSSLSTIDQSAKQVQATLAELKREFSGSSEAVQQVRRELAELAGWIITRLDRK
jgi:hypothetical protein